MLAARAFRILLATLPVWLLLFPAAHPAVSQEPAKLIDPAAGSHPTLEQVVEKLTVRAERLGCSSDDCALLVMNFATTSGSLLMVDIKLTDQLANILAKTLSKGRIIDRSVVREFLARERIPYETFKSIEVRRWLGKEIGATAVLMGDLDVSGPVPQAMFTLFEVADPDKVEYFGTELPASAFSRGDLQASEPFGPAAVPKTTKKGNVVYQAGTAGFSSATCDYMPNPDYTDAAREAKISGTILLDAIVTPEGTVESPQVLKGLPGGLNEVARKTMETWRCKAALRDNQPVSTVVQFEINFRLK
jgi:TonB family protein